MPHVLFACLLFAFAALAADPAPDADAKALQGGWAIDAATLAGRDHGEDFQGMKLVIAGEKFTIEFGKNSDKGTFTLDPAKSPKRIDIKTSPDGPFKGKTLPGIYELNGDKLVLCLDADGRPDARPTKFEAKEMTRAMLLTYKREKK